MPAWTLKCLTGTGDKRGSLETNLGGDVLIGTTTASVPLVEGRDFTSLQEC